jgi:hypothetical protein
MMPYTPKQQYPIPRSPRYQTLNAWRGAACLMAVIYHATLITYTIHTETTSHLASQLVTITHAFNAGLPMFFMISGYCISAAADAAHRNEHSVRSYFTRQFHRIFPPLWAAMGVGVILFLALDYLLFPVSCRVSPGRNFARGGIQAGSGVGTSPSRKRGGITSLATNAGTSPGRPGHFAMRNSLMP